MPSVNPEKAVEWTVVICICLLIGTCTTREVINTFKPARVGTTEIVK